MSKASVSSLQHTIDLTMPWWEDYREALLKLLSEPLAESDIPDASSLQSLLSPAVVNQMGHPIRFVPPASLPDGNYEEQIFNTGRVSTRSDNWHDVFNALVWWRFPALKAAMNALHFGEIKKRSVNGRGKLRDALTLWDECGIIVASTNAQALSDLAARNWQGAFQDLGHCWQDDIRVFVCGHAMLEKFLSPYKAITAHALLVQLDSNVSGMSRTHLQKELDSTLAARLLKGDLIRTTANLSPLPLAGIPGWWTNDKQDDDFYADAAVFRKPTAQLKPAPIVSLNL